MATLFSSTSPRSFLQVSSESLIAQLRHSRGEIATVCAQFQQFTTAVETFSRQLQKCSTGSRAQRSLDDSRSTELRTDENSPTFLSEQLSCLFAHLATQQLSLANTYKHHLVDPLQSLKDDYDTLIKNLSTAYQSAVRNVSEAEVSLEKSRTKYEAAKLEVSNAVDRQELALQETGKMEFELQRIASRLTRAIKEADESHSTYMDTKDRLLSTLTDHDNTVVRIAEKSFQAEFKRIDKLKKCQTEFVGIQKQHMKALEQKLTSLESRIDHIAPDMELAQIVKECQDSKPPLLSSKALTLLDWDWYRSSGGHSLGYPGRELRTAQLSELYLVGEENDFNDTGGSWVSVREERPPKPVSRRGSFKDEDTDVYMEMEALFRLTLESKSTILRKDEEPSLLESPQSSDARSPANGTNGVQTARKKYPLWKGCPVDGITALTKTAVGREQFVRVLNDRRSIDTDVDSGYEDLVIIFDAVLTACADFGDVKVAKTLMIMSETFYQHRKKPTSTKKSKEYLVEQLKHHPIWSDNAFWERALLIGIEEELEKNPQTEEWYNLRRESTTAHYHPTREEAVRRVHNLVLGQLSSFSLGMIEFNISVQNVHKFVHNMCVEYQLPESHRSALLHNLGEIVTRRQQRATHDELPSLRAEV